MQDSTVLPELRMLPTGLLIPHEECDPRRVERLALRIRDEGILKNPPIVAKIPRSDSYVILDGANRVMAFQTNRTPHIVAQLVRYEDPGLILDTWYHVVAGILIEEFNERLTQATGMHLEACNLENARESLRDHQAAAYIVCADGVRKVVNTHSRLQHDITLLNRLVSIYKGRADIFRASNDIWEKQTPYYPGITALVIFPRLKPEHIYLACSSEDKIPTGITRHVIPARAVNVNIPLWVLESGWTQEQKETWLHNWLMDRMSANAIRYYAESTFSFNE